MGVAHYENFPVASWLCPPRLRAPIVAIYHFARTADDLADEGTAAPSARLASLAQYRSDLVATVEGTGASARWPAVFGPLGEAVRRFALPEQPLHDLLDAFEQDARNPSYPTRTALLAYCARSANPVGRLLLHLYGIDDARAQQQSDAVCSALQLINFWQDLAADSSRQRHYVPEEDRRRHGVRLEDLRAGRDSAGCHAMVAELCGWAKALMLEGAALALAVPGRAGWEVRWVVQGGLRVLEKIERMQFATLARRPRLGAADLPLLQWRAWRMFREQRAGASGAAGAS